MLFRSSARCINNSGNASSSRNTNSQGCNPLPANCQRATNRALQLVRKANSGYITGIPDAASIQYCTFLISIDVNNICAAEYQNIGKYECADLSRRQSNAYGNALPQIEAIAISSSVKQARNKCNIR